MTRYHATPEGNVPFTPEEEAEWDALQAEWEAGAADREAAAVVARMVAADYVGFWKALIRSTVYATIKANAKLDLAANVLATELISLLGDAKLGKADVEALQTGIWEVVETLTPELVTELEGLMDTYGMGDYTLTPPA